MRSPKTLAFLSVAGSALLVSGASAQQQAPQGSPAPDAQTVVCPPGGAMMGPGRGMGPGPGPGGMGPGMAQGMGPGPMAGQMGIHRQDMEQMHAEMTALREEMRLLREELRNRR